ncbi:hypothetical protein ILUMI_20119 [Ignelater luminosus]|uniref:MYND-type domain-containing protein n=1 Tax=Ignelater luminosus TaxID=2038154 RepID=A0A8K0CGY3_IGNLU|nr:hypothetical protein ILUMI_20119 [Ignelater luminosus]
MENVDISRAFSSNYPKHLYEKLTQRKEKAESCRFNQSLSNYYKELPTLTYGANNLIECAGDCIEINFERKLGRHIIATRNIEVGDVIAIEKPFSQILLKENYLTHCYNCLKPCRNLIPCDSCSLILFCGENCKITSWNSCHKYECPILASLLDLEVNKLTLVALKICMSVESSTNEFNKDDTLKGSLYKSQNYHEIHNLIANTDARTTSDLFERAVTAAIIFELLQKHTQSFKHEGDAHKKNIFKELLLLHMQTGPSNFHEISELVRTNENFYEVEEIGAGAYAFLSLLNHSCCPNVGEQLFDNYGLMRIRKFWYDDGFLDFYGLPGSFESLDFCNPWSARGPP